MNESYIQLIYNAVLLLALSIVYELSYLFPVKNNGSTP